MKVRNDLHSDPFQKEITRLPVKRVALCFIFIISVVFITAQVQVYDKFEGSRAVTYDTKSGGRLDTAAKNPSASDINSSPTCGKYTRNKVKKFDNLKISLKGKLADVTPYATYSGVPPKFKMKVYTTAPAGTVIELQLGSKTGKNEYPASIHSQYQAKTSKQGEWEELEFIFSQIPQGSMLSSAEVDQIILLFNPGSGTADVYYFDDLTGPTVQQMVTGKDRKK
jgi:hypothetical protein